MQLLSIPRPCCPECASIRIRVSSTLHTPSGGIVRRRLCLACSHRWHTHQPLECALPPGSLRYIRNRPGIVTLSLNKPAPLPTLDS